MLPFLELVRCCLRRSEAGVTPHVFFHQIICTGSRGYLVLSTGQRRKHQQCSFNIGFNRIMAVPNACTAADRAEMLAWQGQPAQCIYGGDGECALSWSQPELCAGPHPRPDTRRRLW